MRRRQRRLRGVSKTRSSFNKSPYDRGLLLIVVILTILGILAVADVSAPQAISLFSDGLFFAKQQLMWGVVGFLGLIFASFIKFTFWRKVAYLIFFVNIILLIAVLIPGIGARVLGARRWIYLGPFNFQPSEFAKLSLVLFMARVCDDGKSFFWSLFGLGAILGLVMLQPDLGTTISIAAIGVVQIFVSGYSILKLLGLGVVGTALVVGLIFSSEYRRLRLQTFLDISSDPLGNSYHIRQILIALGSGGFFGVGLGQSRQKYLFLPETATDSVFAVLAEEIGFAGSMIIFGLLAYFIFRIIKVAMRAPDRFSFILVSGIAAWAAGQIFLNLASMVALTPLTGIPLPFFSYGGTSLTTLLFSLGIVLNVSRYARDEKR